MSFRYCPNIVNMFPNVIEVSSKYSLNTVQILSKYCPNISKISIWYWVPNSVSDSILHFVSDSNSNSSKLQYADWKGKRQYANCYMQAEICKQPYMQTAICKRQHTKGNMQIAKCKLHHANCNIAKLSLNFNLNPNFGWV